MRSRLSQWAFAICAVFALTLVSFTLYGAEPEPRDGAIQSWEHLALTHADSAVADDKELSMRIVRLGNEGWELVTVSSVVQDGTTVKTILYFKRPK